MRSCSIAVGDVASRNITTIEHLSKDGLHPLQQAWITLDVPQCGYCQSGQLMQAAALLTENQSDPPYRIVRTRHKRAGDAYE